MAGELDRAMRWVFDFSGDSPGRSEDRLAMLLGMLSWIPVQVGNILDRGDKDADGALSAALAWLEEGNVPYFGLRQDPDPDS